MTNFFSCYHPQSYRKILLFLVAISMASTSPVSAQRDLRDIPDPDPEVERQSFIVADGFEVNLFAADPRIAKPIHMNFDAQGRLWIASSEVYPHIKPGQQATDKILVVEDADQDGVAETINVFVEGLLIPTGVVPTLQGCFVANSTELAHFVDKDGDLKSDEKQIVLSGFGTEDTHHLLHTLRWGHDGCLYMNQSIYIHSHIETPYGVQRMNGGGIWRFRPETLQLETYCLGFVNPWGIHFDHWGQTFATDGAFGEGINYVFPGAVFSHSPGHPRRIEGLNPGSPKHCGLEILSGRHLPEDWRGNMITNDFRAHRVCRFVVSEDRAGFASQQAEELIKSSHVAFRPIDVKMGPDGAIYIADWYNPIIQHGEVDFRDERRDHVHGRIWRVTAKGRPTLKHPNLIEATTSELMEYLTSAEEWVRLWTKLILKSRPQAEVVESLGQFLASRDPQNANYERQRLEALWVLESLNLANETLASALLASADHRVRAAVLRVVANRQVEFAESDEMLARGVEDEHARVRLEAVRGLAKSGAPEAAEIALRVLSQPMDRFLDFALWKTVRETQEDWLPRMLSGETDLGGDIEHLTFALSAAESPNVVGPLVALVKDGRIDNSRLEGVLNLIASLGNPDDLSFVFRMVVEGPYEASYKTRWLNSLVKSARNRQVLPVFDSDQLRGLLKSDTPALKAAAMRAVGAWKFAELRGALAPYATQMHTGPQEVRFAAYAALGEMGGVDSQKILLESLEKASRFEDQKQVLISLKAINPTLAAERTAEVLAGLVDSNRSTDPSELLSELTSRAETASTLARALENKTLMPDVGKLAIRAAELAAEPSEELILALRQAAKLDHYGWKMSEELMRELVEKTQSEGDPYRGEAIFRRRDLQCLKCHSIAGAGGRVGPDLISIGASAQVDYLIESLLAPNAKVKENFHSIVVATEDGEVFTGIPIGKTDDRLVLRTVENRELVIPVDNIEEQREGKSLMPTGTVDSLTRAELVDLIRFLSELGKLGDFAVGKARVVREWSRLVSDNLNLSDPTVADSLHNGLWETVYSNVQGELPLQELKAEQGTAPFQIVQCHMAVTSAGPLKLHVNEAVGLEFWVDDAPVAAASLTHLNLQMGVHVLTIRIDLEARQAPLRIELVEGGDLNTPVRRD